MGTHKKSWVYILHCSDHSFYTGCTTNLRERVYQHRSGLMDGYTKKRRPVKLVWFEEFNDLRNAISVERQIKKWSRAKKKALIRGDFALLHELAQSREMKNRRMKR